MLQNFGSIFVNCPPRANPSIGALALAGLLAGCAWGTRPHQLAVATTPAGAQVTFLVKGAPAPGQGELFAIDSVGAIIHANRLVRVHWASLATLKVDRLGPAYEAGTPDGFTKAWRQQLALVSRFPQGLNGPLLQRVLAALGQETLGEIPLPEATAGTDTSLDALADSTAQLITRFTDQPTAIAEGYRRLGSDFPGMGEHWLNASVLLSERLDPARPTLLSYVTVAGRQTLVGAGYIVTSQGAAPPATAPGWPWAWHEHSGLFAEESGAKVARDQDARTGTRVWVLHIWTPLSNPGGRYAPDNWALPFARVALVAPEGVDADAGRAFSLVEGGDAYLRNVLIDAGLRHDGNATAVDAAIASARAEALLVAARARADATVGQDDALALRKTWHALGERLHAVIGPEVIPFLTPGHAAHRCETEHPCRPNAVTPMRAPDVAHNSATIAAPAVSTPGLGAAILRR